MGFLVKRIGEVIQMGKGYILGSLFPRIPVLCFLLLAVSSLVGCRDDWQVYQSGPALVNGKVVLGKSGYVYYCFSNTDEGIKRVFFIRRVDVRIDRKGERLFWGSHEFKFPEGSNCVLIKPSGEEIFTRAPGEAFVNKYKHDSAGLGKLVVNLDIALKNEKFKKAWKEVFGKK